MTIERVSVILTCIYVFLILGFVCHHDNTLDKRQTQYTIVAKKQGASDLTGNGGWWVQKKWDNGRIQSEFVQDPFVADTLTVGKTYVVPREPLGWVGYIVGFAFALVAGMCSFFFLAFTESLMEYLVPRGRKVLIQLGKVEL